MCINKKSISCLVLIFIMSMFLTACPSPADESKEAEQHVKEALSIAEEEVTKIYPNAVIKANSFYGISGAQTGPDHLMTDWVKGEYLDGGKEEILINVLTKDIFVTSEWDKISSHGMDSARELYGIEVMDMDGMVSGYMKKPYCVEDPDKYGELEIWNKLPLGTEVNDDLAADLMKNEDFYFLYELEVNENVDMSVFEERDHSSLGRNVRIQVKQYDNEYFRLKDMLNNNSDSESDKVIASYDSKMSVE